MKYFVTVCLVGLLLLLNIPACDYIRGWKIQQQNLKWHLCWRIGTGDDGKFESGEDRSVAAPLLTETGHRKYLKDIKGVTSVQRVAEYDLCTLYRAETEIGDFLVLAGENVMQRLGERNPPIFSEYDIAYTPHTPPRRVLVTETFPKKRIAAREDLTYVYGMVFIRPEEVWGEDHTSFSHTIGTFPLPPVPGCVIAKIGTRGPRKLLYPPLARKIFKQVYPDLWADLKRTNFAVDNFAKTFDKNPGRTP